jgi:hypothetical protein
VKAKRKVLIVTDNGSITISVAKSIAAVFGSAPFANWSATVISAGDFSPTRLLPVHAFFLGCEKPESPDFEPIKELFKHINLAGRPCGVFSTKANAIKYLSGIVRDSDAALGSPFVVEKSAADSRKLKKWIGGIIEEKA